MIAPYLPRLLSVWEAAEELLRWDVPVADAAVNFKISTGTSVCRDGKVMKDVIHEGHSKGHSWCSIRWSRSISTFHTWNHVLTGSWLLDQYYYYLCLTSVSALTWTLYVTGWVITLMWLLETRWIWDELVPTDIILQSVFVFLFFFYACVFCYNSVITYLKMWQFCYRWSNKCFQY